jgi:hypothetical protein
VHGIRSLPRKQVEGPTNAVESIFVFVGWAHHANILVAALCCSCLVNRVRFSVISGPRPDGLDELRFVAPLWLIVLDYTVIAGPRPVLIVAAGALTLTSVLLWLAIAVSVKRYHDHGRSGWFLLIALIPPARDFLSVDRAWTPSRNKGSESIWSRSTSTSR